MTDSVSRRQAGAIKAARSGDKAAERPEPKTASERQAATLIGRVQGDSAPESTDRPLTPREELRAMIVAEDDWTDEDVVRALELRDKVRAGEGDKRPGEPAAAKRKRRSVAGDKDAGGAGREPVLTATERQARLMLGRTPRPGR